MNGLREDPNRVGKKIFHQTGARGLIGFSYGIFRGDSTKTLKYHGRSFILRQVGNIYHKILTGLAP